MKLKFVAALFAASALTIPSQAFAQAAPTAEDIAALRAQIAALQAQLNQVAATQQVQAEQVAKAAAAAAPPPAAMAKSDAPGWFADTKITGKAFFNVSTIDQNSTDLAGNTTDSAQQGTQAELKRFYLGVDHKFNDMFSANLTTDFRYNANGTGKDVLVYVKKAYVQAKFSPAFVVRVGAADLPWVPFMEGLYGYRFVENTLIDRTKFGTSSDWGVHVGGTLAHGVVSYAASAINGAGYKTLSRSSNTIDLEGRINVNPVKEITLGVGGYVGKLGKSAANLPGSATPHQATRLNAVAAYTGKRVRAGIEYFAATNWNTVTTPVRDKSNGWSTFASFAVTPKIGVFGRYDLVKPSRDIAPALKDHYFNVGVDYKPIPPLDFALVFKRDRANDGFISTSNGTIGGLDHGTYNEIGLFGQLAF